MNILHPDIKTLFRALPKAELHTHLAGAYPIYKIREYLRKKGFKENEIAKETAPREVYDDLTDFVNYYDTIAQLVQDENTLSQFTEALCLKAAEDNVRYLELKIAGCEIAPMEFENEEQELEVREKMFLAVRDGVESARKKLEEQGFVQIVKYIYAIERHKPTETAYIDTKLAVDWAKKYGDVVGVDLVGDEVNFSIERHIEALNYARENGLKITMHAGETQNSEQMSATEAMIRAIDFGAKRIGHGLYATEDSELIQKILDNNIVIEVSPSSNVATLSAKSIDTHPIKNMLAHNIPITLCSDDATMFNTKISKEYDRLYKHSIIKDWNTIRQIVLNGVKHAFCDEATKQELIKTFENELERIENSQYFKGVIQKFFLNNNCPCA